MHPARPAPEYHPCPVCGHSVDALRAREVILMPDGPRYLCDVECRRAYVAGERDTQARRPGEAKQPTSGRPISARPSSIAPSRGRARPNVEAPVPVRRVTACVVALLAAILPLGWIGALLSAGVVVGVTTVTASESWTSWRLAGRAAWFAHAVGMAALVIGGLWGAFSADEIGGSMVAAVLAASLFTAREWLGERSRAFAEDSLLSLEENLPELAHVGTRPAGRPLDMELRETVSGDVRTGDEVLVGEGQTVAVDGVILNGSAWVVPHPGTRIPVRKVAGEPLLAGTRVVEGSVMMMAGRVGADRALLRPEAIASGECPMPARDFELATRLSRLMPGAVASLACVSLLVPLVAEVAAPMALIASGTICILAPFTGLIASVTVPLVAGTTAATRRGIVFQSGRAVEVSGRAGVAALCTHGVVTVGAPEVIGVLPIAPEDERHLVALAASAERAAEGHPIARAIHSYAQQIGASEVSARRATHIVGQGVTAVTPDGEPFVLGNRQLLLKEGVSIALADEIAEKQEKRGASVLFMGIGGHTRAVIALNDPIRLGARGAIQRMYDLEIQSALISGDHRTTVEVLRNRLEIQQVRAELLPEERGAEVARLAPPNSKVVAVGCSPEDDAALGAASVPFVMGAAGRGGSDRAVTFVSHDLRDAASALWIAKETRRMMFRHVRLLGIGSGVLAAMTALSVLNPAVALLACLGIHVYVWPAGERLARRIDLRVPRRT